MGHLLTFLLIFSLVAFSAVIAQQCEPDWERVDCAESGATEADCTARNCSWCESSRPNVPFCFYPSADKSKGYRVLGEPVQTANGFKLTLNRVEGGRSTYGSSRMAETLEFELDRQSNERLRIKIRDVQPGRYEVPVKIDDATGGNANPLYDVEYSNDPVFAFKVIRKSNGAVLFDSSVAPMTFADQYIEITTRLPSENLYGIGENEQSSFKHKFDSSRTWALYAKDQPPNNDANMYGVHPRYTVLENDGQTHGVLILNSNAQEFVVGPGPNLLFRTIGGVLDFYFFLGPTPESVVEQYTAAVGRHPLVPYWGLGFHLCRWGYDNIQNMKAVVERTRAARIPQDVQYADIDIMDRSLDFTYSLDRFEGLPEYIREMKSQGIKFVTILDPCISHREPRGSYKAFDWGDELDLWIKRPDGSPAGGTVWPGPCYFPDYSKNVTREYWMTLIKEFHDVIEFDGLWIDMNEPSNFADGDVDGACSENALNNPPFLPKIRGGSINAVTLCADYVSEAGAHYDTHSIYGLSESEPTYSGTVAARGNKRAVVLSRSTFPGSGRYVAHWLGDNYSNWPNLKASIIGLLTFNQFGIPFVGPDICGFFENSNEELCLRWMQVGAFYPFSRNHNIAGTNDQDPAVWSPPAVAAMRSALEIRYELLPHLYTLFFDHVTRGSTVARPLWHEFANDRNTHDVDTQFLWGSGFMVSPVLEQAVAGENATVLTLYFPDARWFSYYDGSEVGVRRELVSTLVAMDTILLHFRGGVIVPTQEPALNTELSRLNPFGLVVALDDQDEASGHLYYDDGDSLDSIESGRYYLARYAYADGELVSTIEHNGWPGMSELRLNNVRLMGVKGDVRRVIISQRGEAPRLFHSFTRMRSGEVRLVNLDLSLTEPFSIKLEN